MRMSLRLGLQRAPMRDRIRPIAVHVEPGDGFAQYCAVEQRFLGACGGLKINEPRLKGQDLLEPLDVAPRDGQHAEVQPIARAGLRSPAPSSRARRWLDDGGRRDVE